MHDIYNLLSCSMELMEFYVMVGQFHLLLVTWLFMAENMAIILHIVEHLGRSWCNFSIMCGEGFFLRKLSLAIYSRQIVLLHCYWFPLHSLCIEATLDIV